MKAAYLGYKFLTNCEASITQLTQLQKTFLLYKPQLFFEFAKDAFMSKTFCFLKALNLCYKNIESDPNLESAIKSRKVHPKRVDTKTLVYSTNN